MALTAFTWYRIQFNSVNTTIIYLNIFTATCFDSCESSSGYTRTIFMAHMVFVHGLGSQPAYRNILKLPI